MRILIIEDETKLAEALVHIFERNGLSADTAENGIYGLDCAITGIYDIIVLDIMLPRKNGLEVLRELRASGKKTPVILLTARDEISDRVLGLDTGADDYLTKPFSSEELLARIRALSRRNADVIIDSELSFGDITLNTSAGVLNCGVKQIKLGLKEMQILELLIKYGTHVLSKEELILKIWGYDSEAEYNNVEVYISFLRKKLTHLHSGMQIKTMRGLGYSLEAGGN